MNQRRLIKKHWGINKKKINLIYGYTGISSLSGDTVPKKIIKDLDITINKFIYQKFTIKDKIKKWIDLKLIKGFKRAQGLTVNGQSVKRNGKTQKKLFKSRLL